jgi:hypothetical protein
MEQSKTEQKIRADYALMEAISKCIDAGYTPLDTIENSINIIANHHKFPDKFEIEFKKIRNKRK